MTHQQARALQFIKDYIAVNGGVSPSFRQIGLHLGLTSMNGVHRIVHALAERKFIEVLPDRARGIRLMDTGLTLTLARDIDLALDRYARKTGTNKATAAAELLRSSLGVA